MTDDEFEGLGLPWTRVPETEKHGPLMADCELETVCDFYEIQSLGHLRGFIKVRYPNANARAAYAVKAANEYPGLLAEVERLQARVAELEGVLSAAASAFAMLVDPGRIESTTALNAWAQCVEVEGRIRAALTPSKEDARGEKS